MYQKILLAYGGTREGRAILREGAELARLCDAQVHLLARWWHGAVDAEILANAPCSQLITIASEVDDGEGNEAGH